MVGAGLTGVGVVEAGLRVVGFVGECCWEEQSN